MATLSYLTNNVPLVREPSSHLGAKKRQQELRIHHIPSATSKGGSSCSTCKGKGAIECRGCKGSGKNKKNGNVFERWKCYDCQGFGLVTCPSCGTSGLTPEQRGER